MRLGVFGGKNSFNHIVVFGLAIMNGESAESMLTGFKNFFEIVGKPPETILTDEQISIAAVLTGCTPKKYVQATISSIISADKKLRKNTKALLTENSEEMKSCLEYAKMLATNENDARALHNFQMKIPN